jgi:predicted ATPase/DNA-binding winged helix-turn-helix (wHTH) protein
VLAEPDIAAAAFLFGSFRLVPAQQMLFDGDARVRIGSRALDILTVLVERPGELVTKRELMARAWPKAVVEEGNLKVHIAALRKALGEAPQDQRYVATVVGRGYRFVAPVKRAAVAAHEVVLSKRLDRAHNIPAELVRPLGRAADIEAVLESLTCTRLVTLTGPGGIGKTTVALAVARTMAECRRREVWFVDLSTVSDARLVPHAVAGVVGLAVRSNDAAAALVNYFAFRNRPQLVVLDNCEHLIEAAASMAERIGSVAPEMLVLATSREPLQAAGEHVYRLGPLDVPVETAGLTAGEALRYPAVQLFMERATARRSGFDLSDDDAPVVAEICRRLDGIALAIELAAARLDAFGARELLGLLDDRFLALGQGRRTAPKRHKTLAAMLDWSHHLLLDVERSVLRRVGIFAGSFSLSSASAVAIDEEISGAGVTDAMASLVAKSMVSADLSGKAVQYRLLDTIRDYARRKLAEAGELDTVARRHAEHFRDIYATADDPARASPQRCRPDEHKGAIDDIRVALNWAFSACGDTSIGIALVVFAIPAWAATLLAGGVPAPREDGASRSAFGFALARQSTDDALHGTGLGAAARRQRVPVTFVIFGLP